MMSDEQSPKVSIIVPMYNVEKYVDKCLESLLAQTLKEIEIIVVDDGSPDDSGMIAESYAVRDPRVIVVHRENGGLGPARNTGITYATGEFIGFVDSDDWVHESYYENLYKAAVDAKADIAVGGMETWTDGKLTGSEPHPLAGKTLRGSGQVGQYRKLLYGRLPEDNESKPFPMAVWSGIYRAFLVKSNGITFHDVLSEDVFFNLQALKLAMAVTYLDGCGYCYRKDRQASITRTYKQTTLSRYTNFFQLLNEYARGESDADECSLRARRKMVDYARSLSFMIVKSNLTLKQKRTALFDLVESVEFSRFCAPYPANSLPAFQSLFQKALVKRRFMVVLFMVRARMMARGER